MKELKQLVRPNIWSLKPYSSARDEYKGVEASVFLDANESPFNNPNNRYPDPLQIELKKIIAPIKGVSVENIFLGNGSDEAIDIIYRTFCIPSVDNVVAIEPTYGMYKVCADINDIEYRKVLLDDSFQFNSDSLLAACDENTKAIFLCSPNNPTGNNLDEKEINKVIDSFQGVVIVDEAYADFSSSASLLKELDKYPNLIVLQTFSKAWGSAAIRLGMAFASPEIISIFSKVKYPYNINRLTQKEAADILKRYNQIQEWIDTIIKERARLIDKFSKLDCCIKIYPTDANFFLAKVTDASKIYNYLVNNGIIVRNRSNIALCNDCLRVTIGSHSENDALIKSLIKYETK